MTLKDSKKKFCARRFIQVYNFCRPATLGVGCRQQLCKIWSNVWHEVISQLVTSDDNNNANKALPLQLSWNNDLFSKFQKVQKNTRFFSFCFCFLTVCVRSPVTFLTLTGVPVQLVHTLGSILTAMLLAIVVVHTAVVSHVTRSAHAPDAHKHTHLSLMHLLCVCFFWVIFFFKSLTWAQRRWWGR